MKNKQVIIKECVTPHNRDNNLENEIIENVVEKELPKQTTALISMSATDKDRLTTASKEHGLSLSAFFRLAAYEYIQKHKW